MKRALLIIDVQNVYFTGMLPISYPPGSFHNITRAMDFAAERKIPVVVIQHTSPEGKPPVGPRGQDAWQLLPEIAKRKCDVLIEKTWPGSFTDTDLESWLRAKEIDTVTIAGYMTQMCCDTTSRQAFHLGFNVEFLSDATGTLAISNPAGSVTAEELHRSILVTQAMRFSKVLSLQTWMDSIK